MPPTSPPAPDFDFDLDELVETLKPILDPNEGDVLQVVYLRLGDGQMTPFVGLPMSREAFKGVDGLGLGDLIEVRYDDMVTLVRTAPHALQ